MQDFYDKVIVSMDESENERIEMQKRVTKMQEETRLRMEIKRKAFDKKRKSREKYFGN